MLTPRRLLMLLASVLLAASANSAEIEQLVQQLDASEFSQRKAATDQLTDRGAAAIPAIVEAAASESREVAVRAHWILQKHFRNGDAETKQAAKAALEQLADGEGSAARRAQQTLEPKPNPSQVARGFAPRRIVVNGQVGGRIQIRQVGGNVRQIQIQQFNGTKRIRVDANGQKIEIQEDPKNGIKMQITEKKDGKEITKKYQADDVAELKKKHPDAYKIYEKHGKQNGGIQIRFAQGNLPALPQPPRAAQDRKELLKKAVDDQIKKYEQKARQSEGAQKEMYERTIETFKRQRKALEDRQQRRLPNPFAPAAPKEIDEIRRQLEQQQAELRKQMEARRAKMQEEIEAIADRVEQARRESEESGD